MIWLALNAWESFFPRPAQRHTQDRADRRPAEAQPLHRQLPGAKKLRSVASLVRDRRQDMEARHLSRGPPSRSRLDAIRRRF